MGLFTLDMFTKRPIECSVTLNNPIYLIGQVCLRERRKGVRFVELVISATVEVPSIAGREGHVAVGGALMAPGACTTCLGCTCCSTTCSAATAQSA